MFHMFQYHRKFKMEGRLRHPGQYKKVELKTGKKTIRHKCQYFQKHKIQEVPGRGSDR